jgi:hypothetical protein
MIRYFARTVATSITCIEFYQSKWERELMTAPPDEIRGWAAIGFTVAAFIASVGGFVHKVRSHGARLKNLEQAVTAIPEDIKRRLYQNDGQPIYLPVTAFEKAQALCAGSLKEDIERVEKKLDHLIELHLKGGQS